MLTEVCFATLVKFLLLPENAVTVIATDESSENCNRVPIQQRKNCGFNGITGQQCRAKGCCFDSSKIGVVWCFYQPTIQPQKKPSADDEDCKKVPAHQRINCGFNGITRQQCHAKLCCFDSSELGVIWCFKRPSTQKYPKPTTTTTSTTTTPATTTKIVPPYKPYVTPCYQIPLYQRMSCGFPGITHEQCHARGCCFDYAAPNVFTMCFRKSKGKKYPKPTSTTTATSTTTTTTTPSTTATTTKTTTTSSTTTTSRPTVPSYRRKPKKSRTCRQISVDQRISCGYPGIIRRHCRARGCCFDNTSPNVLTRCFAKTAYHQYPMPTTVPPYRPLKSPKCRRIPTDQRVSCGAAGITRRECRASGCCFDRRAPDGGIQCFTRSQQPHMPRTGSCYQCRFDAAQGFRRCGGNRITERRCRTRRCCWLRRETDVDSANVSTN